MKFLFIIKFSIFSKRCSGQVGYMICNMRSIKEAFVGDTIYLDKAKVEPFKGFKAPQPMANKIKFNIFGVDLIIRV